MSFLVIFEVIVAALGLLLLAAFLILVLQYFLFFRWRNCKHCGHTMKYKGFKEDNNNGHYLFHCPNCGAWEQIPREEFFRQCDNPIDEV